MAVFDTAYDITSRFEGLYSYHPDDRGGETWKGISRRFHPGWDGWTIIDQYDKTDPLLSQKLNRDTRLELLTRQFYKKEFWDKLFGDDNPSQAIAQELYDTGVNVGIGRAVQYLQDSLNVLNRVGRDYPDVSVDGSMGQGTLTALKKCLSFPKNESYLYKAINILQGAHYINIMRRDASQETFSRGWLDRVEIIKS